ncbi:hypothetical protein JST97_27095 [bacterium]|nr:hypothetical protein [bacterium]
MAKCKESAGVLYPHPCTRESTRTCGRCSKAICDLHSRQTGAGGVVCIACFRASTPVSTGGDDAFLLAAAVFSDYDTGTAVRRRLNQAMLASDGDLEAFETEFDGT